jgi:hypothetical protein
MTGTEATFIALITAARQLPDLKIKRRTRKYRY